jgi:hypothetical protein
MLTGVAATHRRVIFGFQFIDVTKIVLAQPEMEKRRSPLV